MGSIIADLPFEYETENKDMYTEMAVVNFLLAGLLPIEMMNKKVATVGGDGSTHPHSSCWILRLHSVRAAPVPFECSVSVGFSPPLWGMRVESPTPKGITMVLESTQESTT